MADNFEPLKSEEDVEEILRLAVRHSGVDGGSLRERLQASAAELGISSEALAEAERAWATKNRSLAEQEQEKLDRKEFRRIRVGDFVTHLGSYLAVNAFLLWIDARDGDVGWVYWPIMGWGIGMAIHLFSLFAHGSEQEEEFRKWQKKKRRRRA